MRKGGGAEPLHCIPSIGVYIYIFQDGFGPVPGFLFLPPMKPPRGGRRIPGPIQVEVEKKDYVTLFCDVQEAYEASRRGSKRA